MRNELTFHGLGGSGAGYMMLSEKITFGGFLDRGSVAFRPYGMISAAFGFYSTAGKELFSDPFALDFLGGGGFDIYYSKTSAFFVEYGGGFLWLPGTTDADAVSSTGKAFITLGTKVFLN